MESYVLSKKISFLRKKLLEQKEKSESAYAINSSLFKTNCIQLEREVGREVV